ncbi:AGM1, partial [Symbiodinium natans]
PWTRFRSEVIGATNPEDAVSGSLRARIRDEWNDLGLLAETNYQDNGVHASASPLEALRERQVWLGDDVTSDAFGQRVAERSSVGLQELVGNCSIALGEKS